LLVLKAKQAGLDQGSDFLRAQKNLLVSRYKNESEATNRSCRFPAERSRRDTSKTIDKYSRPAKVRLAIIYAKSEQR